MATLKSLQKRLFDPFLVATVCCVTWLFSPISPLRLFFDGGELADGSATLRQCGLTGQADEFVVMLINKDTMMTTAAATAAAPGHSNETRSAREDRPERRSSEGASEQQQQQEELGEETESDVLQAILEDLRAAQQTQDSEEQQGNSGGALESVPAPIASTSG